MAEFWEELIEGKYRSKLVDLFYIQISLFDVITYERFSVIENDNALTVLFIFGHSSFYWVGRRDLDFWNFVKFGGILSINSKKFGLCSIVEKLMQEFDT